MKNNHVSDGDYCKRSIETAGIEVYGIGFYNSATSFGGSLAMILLTLALSSI